MAVSQIIASTLEDPGMRMPTPTVNLDGIRAAYHPAEGSKAKKQKKA